MSDSDAAFIEVITVMRTKKFQKILSNNNAVLEAVKLNDHHALGVIDIFAKNLKCVLSKDFLENKDTEWVSYITQNY